MKKMITITTLPVLLLSMVACSGDAAFTNKEEASLSIQNDQSQGDSLSANEPVIAEIVYNTPFSVGERQQDSGGSADQTENRFDARFDIVDVYEFEPMETLDDISSACDTRNITTSTVSFFFPKPNRTCEWGQNGNLGKDNGNFQARIEQRAMLDLPEGAVICDAEFQFPEQEFRYDDHFLLTLNDSVIVSSYDFEDRLDLENGLLKYDWLQIAGMDWVGSDETIYCPEIPGAHSSCSFPDTDKNGVIELNYDSVYIQSIMANGLPQNHSFTMVTIGDDNFMDCEHSDINFSVEVKYFIQ